MGWLKRGLALLVFAGLALWLLGPYEPVDLEARFDPAGLGGDLDAYFARVEAAYDDITPGTEKRVIWAGTPGARTEWAVFYVHGFSATSEEIRPVPDQVADALGANLIFTRLAGHGRGGDAMAEPQAGDWMVDLAEGLAAARRAGRRVLVISTSTGGTLVTAAAQDAALMEGVAGLVFVSPNYRLNSPVAGLLNWPAARYWLPLMAGAERSFAPQNEGHARFWSTTYPSTAVFPMAALVKAVAGQDKGAIITPALFYFSDDDRVVDPAATRSVADAWGGPVAILNPSLTEADDPFSHVIAGDILSPGQTETASRAIINWAQGLAP